MDPLEKNIVEAEPAEARSGPHHSVVRYISRLFVRGLVLILPLAITIYLLVWLARILESALGGLLKAALPEKGYFRYIPGMGLLAGIALIFLLGFLLQSGYFRRLWRWAERQVESIPLVRLVYNSVKEVISYVGGAQTTAAQSVVMVTLQDGVRMVGLVTRENMKGVAEGGENEVAVFLPWSYQVGGITVLVPRSRITPLDMTVEQGFRFAFTAGVSGSTKAENSKAASEAESSKAANQQISK
jgi:uncharacterized membrane protein